MQLSLKTMTGRTYIVETNPDDTVGEFKEKIYQKSKMPTIIQRVLFRGRELTQNHLMLSECGIDKEMWLHLLYLKNDECYIEVDLNLNDNKSLLIMNVYFGALIEDIKFKIQDQSGYPCDDIKIFCNDKEMEDSESIEKYITLYLKL